MTRHPRFAIHLRALFAALAPFLADAPTADAICDVIPQSVQSYRGETGSLDRVFASPGDRVEVSIDRSASGCEASVPPLDGTIPGVTLDDFTSDIDGWSENGANATIQHEAAGGNPGGWLHGARTAIGFYDVIADASFEGDWAARGVSQLSFDYQIDSLCGGAPLSGLRHFVKLSTTSGLTSWVYQIDPSAVGFVEGSWVHFDIPIDPADPGPWIPVAGQQNSWADFLMHDVGSLRILGTLVTGGGYCDESGIDNVALTEADQPANVATVLFKPPGGPPSAAVLTSGSCGALAAELATCATDLGGGTVSCIDSVPATVTADRFSFPFPDTGWAGPATIAISPASSLPCELATVPCSDPGAPTDLRACIDRLYAPDSTCETGDANRHAQFPGFTALPPLNDYAEVCTSTDPDSPCVGAEPDVRLTIDADGNALVPMGWTRVLVPGGIPIPRIVSGDTLLEAFDSDATPGTDPPIALPGGSFLRSFSPRGQPVAPLFSPIGDPSDSSRMLGSVDATRGVIRIARRGDRYQACAGGDRDGLPCNFDVECPNGGTCAPGTCQGGANVGNQCSRDVQCPGSECGPSLFDLSDRLASGVGPIVIPGSDYAAEARNPVAIDTLLETPTAVVTVRSEPLEGGDANADQIPDGAELNGDGDMTDKAILTIRRKTDDTDILIGPGSSLGSAVARSLGFEQGQQAFETFAVTGVAVEGELVAFLSSEAQDGVAANADGDTFDYPVNVLRGPDYLPVNQPALADPERRINGRSIVVSQGNVFWRQPEADDAAQVELRMDVDASGSPGNAESINFDMSRDGRYVVFDSRATNLVPGGSDSNRDVFLHDRDTDADGVFDEAGAIDTVQVNLLPGGVDPADDSSEPAISANGRFVAFYSKTDFLGLGLSGSHVYVYDRDTAVFHLMTIFDDGTPFTNGLALAGTGLRPDVSGDGRFVAWRQAVDPVTGLAADIQDTIYVHDRDADEDGLFDDEGNGYTPGEIAVFPVKGAMEPNSISAMPALSEDGRWVAFISDATNLTGQPDGNLTYDAFVAETYPGATPIRVSETTFGEELQGSTYRVDISENGRRVVMTTSAQNIERPQGVTTTFVRDRDPDGDGTFDEPGQVLNTTIETDRYDQSEGGVKGPGIFVGLLVEDNGAGLVNVGRFDQRTGVFAAGPPADAPGAISGNVGVKVRADALGREILRDLPFAPVLASSVDLDPSAPANAGVDLNGDGDLNDTILRVLDGTDPVTPIAAAVLGPARDVAVSNGIAAFLMPEAEVGAGTDLDGDGFDPDDEVVHLWTGGPSASNLGRAATAVALSAQYLAVIDRDSGNVFVTPVAGAPAWIDLGLQGVGESLSVVGTRVAFLDPSGQVHIWEAGTGFLTSPSFVAADLVLGDEIAAFRVLESVHGDQNQDGDTLDAVLYVVDLAADHVYNTEFAAVPCPVKACDPTRPYTVDGKRVRFLTLEPQQDPSPVGCKPVPGGCDLDGDGLGAGLVLQRYNLAAVLAGSSGEEATDAVAKTATGICTDTGEACVDDADCPVGECFVPPGGCIRDLGSSCTFSTSLNGGDSCSVGEFCVPDAGMPGTATCHVREGPCSSDAQCTAPAFCVNDDQDFQRLVSAVEGSADGGELLVSAGRCLKATVTACAINADCGSTQICEDDVCHDAGDSCRVDSDCEPGYTCENRVTVVASGDGDGDGTSDALDNCPDVPNEDQMDLDGDGVGDACDRQTCGNGIQEYSESCDDGDQNGLDGLCDAQCQYLGVDPVFACNDGIDNDGDGLIDLADPGCDDASDTSERSDTLVCDDGRDNDGDYGVDVGGDLGCQSPTSAREDPACSNGIDDDGDGKIDWDGVNGLYVPDPQCPVAYKVKETKKGCGIGYELAFVLPLLRSARRRRRRRLAA